MYLNKNLIMHIFVFILQFWWRIEVPNVEKIDFEYRILYIAIIRVWNDWKPNRYIVKWNKQDCIDTFPKWNAPLVQTIKWCWDWAYSMYKVNCILWGIALLYGQAVLLLQQPTSEPLSYHVIAHHPPFLAKTGCSCYEDQH